MLSRRAPRLLSRTSRQSYRASSTSRAAGQIDLAYDLYEPPKSRDAAAAPQNAPIVFMHGLFGSKKNNRSMSKVLARELQRPVYAIDLRNHGDSSHNPRHDYTALGEDVEGFIRQHKLEKPTLIGHSMGAKAAMTVALHSPALIANLVAVDNAPVDANFKSDFGSYVRGMRKIDEARVKRLGEADALLQPYAKELAVRQFLLTNLVRAPDGSHLRFRVPVNILANSLDNMWDFPYKNPDEVRFEGPTLFVRGTKSHYVPDETLPIIGRFFPRFEVRDVEAGHWVISENPEAFRQAVVEWLQDKE